MQFFFDVLPKLMTYLIYLVHLFDLSIIIPSENKLLNINNCKLTPFLTHIKASIEAYTSDHPDLQTCRRRLLKSLLFKDPFIFFFKLWAFKNAINRYEKNTNNKERKNH